MHPVDALCMTHPLYKGGREVESTPPVFGRRWTCTLSTSCSFIIGVTTILTHGFGQFKVANEPHVHVFELLEEADVCHCFAMENARDLPLVSRNLTAVIPPPFSPREPEQNERVCKTGRFRGFS